MDIQKGLVLAAGMGTRLADSQALPKPLVKVDGVPMIYRTINSLREAGVSEIGVVLGYKADQVQEAVAYYAAMERITVRFLENPRFAEPNGLSLYAAREFAGGDEFIMTMVDHLFDPEIVSRLRQIKSCPGATLAVDRDIERVFDLDDATKVQTRRDGRIKAIGKGIASYNAIDCGLFRCTPQVFTALEQAFAAGRFSISDGMQVLAQDDRFVSMPVRGLFWQDMDTPEMLHQAEQVARWAEAALSLRLKPAWLFALQEA